MDEKESLRVMERLHNLLNKEFEEISKEREETISEEEKAELVAQVAEWF